MRRVILLLVVFIGGAIVLFQLGRKLGHNSNKVYQEINSTIETQEQPEVLRREILKHVSVHTNSIIDSITLDLDEKGIDISEHLNEIKIQLDSLLAY